MDLGVHVLFCTCMPAAYSVACAFFLSFSPPASFASCQLSLPLSSQFLLLSHTHHHHTHPTHTPTSPTVSLSFPQHAFLLVYALW